jgi:hypothetical protein
MSAVLFCVCPDGQMHGFPELQDGRADHAFCGIKHEYVRDGHDDDLVCDVCVVEMQVFLGIPRDQAVQILKDPS